VREWFRGNPKDLESPGWGALNPRISLQKLQNWLTASNNTFLSTIFDDAVIKTKIQKKPANNDQFASTTRLALLVLYVHLLCNSRKSVEVIRQCRSSLIISSKPNNCKFRSVHVSHRRKFEPFLLMESNSFPSSN